MSWDYTFVTTYNGQTRATTYQHLVKNLGLETEIVEGYPMTAGGTPQAFFMQSLLQRMFPGATVSFVVRM